MKTTRFDLYTTRRDNVPAGHIILDTTNLRVTLHKPYAYGNMQVYSQQRYHADDARDFPGHVIRRDEKNTRSLGIITGFELTVDRELVDIHDGSCFLTFAQTACTPDPSPPRLQAYVLVLDEMLNEGKLVKLRPPGENGNITIHLDTPLARRGTTLRLLPLVADYTGRRSRPVTSLPPFHLPPRAN